MTDAPNEPVRPKKRFGQNFLHDVHALDKIAQLCGATAEERILEVGPGTGNLTAALLKTPAAKIIAVERDRSLLPVLEKRFSEQRLTVHSGDAIHFDYAAHCPGPQRHVVAGNLPYNAATEIYFRLLENRSHIRRVVLMFQREVAQRIVAPEGSKTYGILSVMTALHATSRIALRLPPGAFFPPPKVHSAVVVADLCTAHRFDVAGDEIGFRRMIGAAFGARRKTLVNALTRQHWDKEDVQEALTEIDCPPTVRAEALSPEQLGALWCVLHARGLARPRGA